MDSPCSVNRRQAWAQCSRQWLTVEDTEPNASASGNVNTTPATQLSLQDEVFPDGRLQSSKCLHVFYVLATEKRCKNERLESSISYWRDLVHCMATCNDFCY